MRTTARAAFFDVDETLVAAKTMVEFSRFWLRRRGSGPCDPTAADVLEELLALPREEANRAYYAHYRGILPAELAEAGLAWYALYRQGPQAMIAPALDALRAHRERGDRIVLVSGSLRACLQPLADELGASLLCTGQEVGADGRFTGTVNRSMIGPGKLRAVTEALGAWRLDPEDCWAYGDHASDLAMLEAVGNPVVVGDDPLLRQAAERHGWPVLPVRTGPLIAPGSVRRSA
ncbi:HAD family hydrolase [Streptomyces sp. NPDC048603]|uniref:HAD family hydrolase n=1 Tax=Streptomyces sp. NPDC048603 TaxID=3365577 RepID=UPI0037123D88